MVCAAGAAALGVSLAAAPQDQGTALANSLAGAAAGGERDGMELFECKAEIAIESAELANDTLLEWGRDNWSVLEDVIVRRAWVCGICTSESEAQVQWTELKVLLMAAGVALKDEPKPRALPDADWRDSYKAHFKAWQFGRLHWVPVWERETFVLPAGDAVLWLDPGLAFGTGNHETTRLCVERLVDLAEKQGVAGKIIDAGCGSGILALSSALLGWREIAGFDNDAEATRVSEENAALNGLTGRVEFFTGDLVTGLAGRQAGVVLANIQADVLMRYAQELLGSVTTGGTLVLSGILAMERDKVRAAFVASAPGWAVESRIMGEWSDVVLTRPTI